MSQARMYITTRMNEHRAGCTCGKQQMSIGLHYQENLQPNLTAHLIMSISLSFNDPSKKRENINPCALCLWFPPLCDSELKDIIEKEIHIIISGKVGHSKWISFTFFVHNCEVEDHKQSAMVLINFHFSPFPLSLISS